jgi:hypothetical protein
MSNQVGLQDVQSGFQTDVLEAPTSAATIAKMAIAPPAKTTATHVVFKLKDTHRNGRVHLPTEDYVVNPATKEYEKMRLLKGVQSIWVKDQKHMTKDDIKTHATSLTFEKNVMRIPVYDKQTLEFLRLTSMNMGSETPNKSAKFQFYEYKPEVAAKEELEREEKEIEAVLAAKEMPEDKMRKHALFLGISFTDDITGLPKEPSAIRRDYMRIAKRNAKVFMDTKESPEVEISFMVKKAISDAKIDLGKQPNSVFWTNGPFICKVQPGQTPVDALVELAMTNSNEGRDFKDKLETIAR